MTFQQLRLVLESADCGSISAAAEKLRISQPNASQSVKKLEDEIGFTVFRRMGNGIIPTEQGYQFLEHARTILREDQAIRSIGSEERTTRLRVGVMNYAPAIEAFLRFIQEKKDSERADLVCFNVSPEDGARLLKERSLDIIISLQIKEMMPLSEKQCREYRFTMTRHATIPICVRVGEDHPLYRSGALDGSPKGFELLSRYPYIEYRNLSYMMQLYNDNAAVPFGYRYKIFVDERDTRLRALKAADAFSIGCLVTKSRLEQYGLVTIPVGSEATLVSYVRKGDEELPDIARYMEILTEEVEKE